MKAKQMQATKQEIIKMKGEIEEVSSFRSSECLLVHPPLYFFLHSGHLITAVVGVLRQYFLNACLTFAVT
jgi:hypothetical protein